MYWRHAKYHFGHLYSVATVLVLVAALLGCTGPGTSSEDNPEQYVSVWAQLYPDSLKRPASPDSLQGMFHAAARAHDDTTARERWERFLDEFDPEDGYFEDTMHARYVEWAKLELVRLRHRSNSDNQAEAAQVAKMRQTADAVNSR